MKSSNKNNGFVVLDGVSKRYKNLLALDNVSLEVKDGEGTRSIKCWVIFLRALLFRNGVR